MFQTDELVKIINQLQHADGMGVFRDPWIDLKVTRIMCRSRYDYCSSDRNRIFLAETGS